MEKLLYLESYERDLVKRHEGNADPFEMKYWLSFRNS